MAFNIENFIAGFIGALAPEIVRLYKIRLEKLSFPSTYYAISFLYAFVGGYIGTIRADITPYFALGMGVALPVVISLAGKAVMIAQRAPRGPPMRWDPDYSTPLDPEPPPEPSHMPFSKFITYLFE